MGEVGGGGNTDRGVFRDIACILPVLILSIYILSITLFRVLFVLTE